MNTVTISYCIIIQNKTWTYGKPKAAKTRRVMRVKFTVWGTLMPWSPGPIFSFAAGWYCKSSCQRRVLDQIGTAEGGISLSQNRGGHLHCAITTNHHSIRASEHHNVTTLQHSDIAWHCKFSATYHDKAIAHSKNNGKTASAATATTTTITRNL